MWYSSDSLVRELPSPERGRHCCFQLINHRPGMLPSTDPRKAVRCCCMYFDSSLLYARCLSSFLDTKQNSPSFSDFVDSIYSMAVSPLVLLSHCLFQILVHICHLILRRNVGAADRQQPDQPCACPASSSYSNRTPLVTTSTTSAFITTQLHMRPVVLWVSWFSCLHGPLWLSHQVRSIVVVSKNSLQPIQCRSMWDAASWRITLRLVQFLMPILWFVFLPVLEDLADPWRCRYSHRAWLPKSLSRVDLGMWVDISVGRGEYSAESPKTCPCYSFNTPC
jgi:hypothetical protein